MTNLTKQSGSSLSRIPIWLEKTYLRLHNPLHICMIYNQLRKTIQVPLYMDCNLMASLVNLIKALWTYIMTLESYLTWKYPILPLWSCNLRSCLETLQDWWPGAYHLSHSFFENQCWADNDLRLYPLHEGQSWWVAEDYLYQSGGNNQSDKIGRFLNFLVTNVLTKVVQIFW